MTNDVKKSQSHQDRVASGDIIGFVDADGAIPVFEIVRLFQIADIEKSVVFGSRWVKESRVIERENFRNVIGGRVFHYLSFAVLGIKEKDTFCGLKAFPKDTAKSIESRIMIRDRTFNVAIAYHLRLMDIRPIETGITWTHKDGSKLPVSLRVIVVMFITLIGLRLAHWKKFDIAKHLAVKFRDILDFY